MALFFNSGKALSCLASSHLYQVLGDGADGRQGSEIACQDLGGSTGFGGTQWEGWDGEVVCPLCLSEWGWMGLFIWSSLYAGESGEQEKRLPEGALFRLLCSGRTLGSESPAVMGFPPHVSCQAARARDNYDCTTRGPRSAAGVCSYPQQTVLTRKMAGAPVNLVPARQDGGVTEPCWVGGQVWASAAVIDLAWLRWNQTVVSEQTMWISRMGSRSELAFLSFSGGSKSNWRPGKYWGLWITASHLFP